MKFRFCFQSRLRTVLSWGHWKHCLYLLLKSKGNRTQSKVRHDSLQTYFYSQLRNWLWTEQKMEKRTTSVKKESEPTEKRGDHRENTHWMQVHEWCMTIATSVIISMTSIYTDFIAERRESERRFAYCLLQCRPLHKPVQRRVHSVSRKRNDSNPLIQFNRWLDWLYFRESLFKRLPPTVLCVHCVLGLTIRDRSTS